ncbi:L-allo-threonine dehydrogenase, NAD(P)-binding [Legionella beliardensis]|uniref:L-allo-threonine dehydrogenase, NAD(P)-binding n=1 Tax=Legionella beliardensis TaxID=91822 RepID=A0A378I2F1_9GAMM|nr:SDR family NAD(P)-dependent oxidoreductase [Legionella beliardensis]STX28836.1 L-allo-threonine dehydrogenase, NAD(P)-binding [Legionella beliardensis]
MATSLDKKIVLITGASSGIGEACAKLLAAQGANLILTARRFNKLQALANTLQQKHAIEVLPIELDVRDQEAMGNFYETLPTAWQPIDILINNAGLALATDPIQQGQTDNWDTMIDTNIKGLLYISRFILPSMIKRGQGHVVNMGSVAGQDCYVNGNVYCATKHAVRSITKSMRLDLAGTGIRVTEIAPGAVDTEFSVVRWNDAEKAKAFYQGFDPLMGEDIADAVLYALTRPAHVNIAEMTIFPTAQASCSLISRTEKS